MSRLRAVLDRMNDIEATIVRTEQSVGPKPDFATQLTLQSLEERRDMLRQELAEITKHEHVEVCDYRIIPESPLAYAVTAVSSALQDFQDLVSIVFDAQSSKAKRRAKIAPDIIQKTRFDFGFAYSGSLGVVLTIPNDRLLMDEASRLDSAVDAVLELLQIRSPEALREASHAFGLPAIRKLHHWTKTQSQYGMTADIKWVRDANVRKETLAQPSEMAEIAKMIEDKSDKTRDNSTMIGDLLAWNVQKRTFTMEFPNADPISGHWAADFLSPGVTRKVPGRYQAHLTKETTILYAEDREDVRWLLNRLVEIRVRK
jgi:hypothetical protein